MNPLIYIYENHLGFTCFDRYFEYLKSIEAEMPEPMRSFALDIGRYELNGPHTLHDAWLRAFYLDQEIKNQQVRKSVHLDFELASDKRILTLKYKNVIAIKTELNSSHWPDRPVDLLVHEISKCEQGLFRHIFIFDRDVKIDISFDFLEVEEKSA